MDENLSIFIIIVCESILISRRLFINKKTHLDIIVAPNKITEVKLYIQSRSAT
jgi:hypothetical protein